MKTLTLSFLLLAGCASSSDFGLEDNTQHNDCEHGEVQVRVGLTGPGTGMERFDNRVNFAVEVANNSREDIVVKAIRVEQTHRDMADYLVEDSYRAFKETIAEDEDELFELPTTGKSLFASPNRQTSGSDALYFSVSVYLEDGTYRCEFAVPNQSR